jgi:hypothetical protein
MTMGRLLFGSPFTVPRLLGGLVLVAAILRGTGHSWAWVAAFFAAIPAGCALAVAVMRSMR